MQIGRIYKIDVDQKTYVVKVVGWKKDSLVAQTNFKKEIKQNFAESKIKFNYRDNVMVNYSFFDDLGNNIKPILTLAEKNLCQLILLIPKNTNGKKIV